jgi:succinylarginine dihydrolase
MTPEARMKHQARRAKILIFAGRKDLLNAWVDRYSGDRVKMRQLIDEII